MYYREATAAVIVYDITRRKSYDTMEYWITELQQSGPPDIILVIAGNKCDLEHKRRVSF